MRGWQGFEYAEVVHKIAAYLVARPNQTDVLGNMRDDYVSELAIEALIASRIYRAKHGKSQKAEARYVHRSLWNFARDQKRSRYWRGRFFFQTADYELDAGSLETWCEARDSIRVLQKNLDRDNLRILSLLAAAEGDMREAWEADPWCHRVYFYELAKRARKAGKMILQN